MAVSYSERYVFQHPGVPNKSSGWIKPVSSCGQRHALVLEFNFALLTLIIYDEDNTINKYCNSKFTVQSSIHLHSGPSEAIQLWCGQKKGQHQSIRILALYLTIHYIQIIFLM